MRARPAKPGSGQARRQARPGRLLRQVAVRLPGGVFPADDMARLVARINEALREGARVVLVP